jgi:hypothetical protein
MMLVLVAVVMVGAFVAFLRAQKHFDRWNQAFAVVGRRFGGQFTPGGWFSNPSLWLPHGTVSGRLTTYTLYGRNGPRCLELLVQLPDARHRCEVSYRYAKTHLASVSVGLQALVLDWDDFGRRWYVMTDDPDEARLILSSGVRWHIDQLWLRPALSDAFVSITPGWLVIRKQWNSSQGSDIVQFVELGLGLYDQMLITRSVGIEFVESSEMQVIEDAHCKVCGEEFGSEIVCCRRCKTPHHRECWEYNGGCSTYACRETNFLVPQQARPLPSLPPREERSENRPSQPR